ncbi:MAG: hypothetical protein ABIJ31_02395 [Pseudomonadota bacterium]
MPFKSIVDVQKNIVVLKAKGKISVMDIISEIQHAITIKRGDGITRRLIDMTEQVFSYNVEDVQKIKKMMDVSAKVLGSRRVAVLFKEIPENSDFEKIIPLLNSSVLEIQLFTDRTDAVSFLNKPTGKKKKQ